MAGESFQQTIDLIKDEAVKYALDTFRDLKDEAREDALKLVEEIKVNLKKWTLELTAGDLTKQDFEFLMLGEKELIEMNALKQAGVKLLEADAFKTNLLKLIINTTISKI